MPCEVYRDRCPPSLVPHYLTDKDHRFRANFCATFVLFFGTTFCTTFVLTFPCQISVIYATTFAITFAFFGTAFGSTFDPTFISRKKITFRLPTNIGLCVILRDAVLYLALPYLDLSFLALSYPNEKKRNASFLYVR